MFREAALEKAAHPFRKEQIPGVFRLPVAVTAAILAVVITSFSGLNHLTDLTMKRKEYAALLGYTPREIAEFFPKRLDALAKKNKTDRKGRV